MGFRTPLNLGLSLALAGLLFGACPVWSQQQPSRLSRLLLNQHSMYLPVRLTLGAESRFVIKGEPGMSVRLYLSSQASGLSAPNGEALRVGTSHEALEGKIQENGLVEMTIELPKEASMAGHTMYVDAVAWRAADHSDLSRVQLIDASGRRTGDNGLLLSMPSDGGHTTIIPMLPGMNPQMIQQLSTVTEALHDERKRELMYDGERDEDTVWDRNSLITRPGLTPIK